MNATEMYGLYVTTLLLGLLLPHTTSYNVSQDMIFETYDRQMAPELIREPFSNQVNYLIKNHHFYLLPKEVLLQVTYNCLLILYIKSVTFLFWHNCVTKSSFKMDFSI